MDTAVFLRGLAIGFGIAAPVGPIGILCIRRLCILRIRRFCNRRPYIRRLCHRIRSHHGKR